MGNLDHYQGRNPITGHSAMFTTGFRAGRTREEDVPQHFVRIGGSSRSHDVGDDVVEAGVDCVQCMATAARMRQWVESLRLGPYDPPDHER